MTLFTREGWSAACRVMPRRFTMLRGKVEPFFFVRMDGLPRAGAAGPRLLRPDGKLAATRRLEVKTPAAGEFKNITRNFSAEPANVGANFLQV